MTYFLQWIKNALKVKKFSQSNIVPLSKFAKDPALSPRRKY